MVGTTIECANCGEAAPDGATWCEACGHELGVAPKPACVSCGEREVDAEEGYCLSCGYRQPRERDHHIVGDGPVVAISDRGRRHHHNEDAAAVGWIPPAEAGQAGTAIVVVCDGVSSTPGSAEASASAAVSARDHLVAGLASEPVAGGAGPSAEGDREDDQDQGDGAPSDGPLDVGELLVGAVAAAQVSAAGAPEPDIAVMADGPPSSTFVAVIARPAGSDEADGAIELTTAWVGDSRAYWVGPDEASQLSGPDHELGGSLVRWLGSDSIDPTPDLATKITTEPGHLVVCTDGLWRYAAEPAELAGLVRRLISDGRNGASLAEAMVDHANESGGHDNITVALWSDHGDWPTDTSTHPSIASAAVNDPER